MFIKFQNHEPNFLFSFRDLLFYFTFRFITYLELNYVKYLNQGSFFFYRDNSLALYHLVLPSKTLLIAVMNVCCLHFSISDTNIFPLVSLARNLSILCLLIR